MNVTLKNLDPLQAATALDDYKAMAALDEFQPWAAEAVRDVMGVLPGKRRNYSGEERDPFDNFDSVAAIEAILYAGMTDRQNTPQGAILHMLLHKVVRLVRGAEWEEAVGEGQEMSALDIHGYAALLHGWFKRRGRTK